MSEYYTPLEHEARSRFITGSVEIIRRRPESVPDSGPRGWLTPSEAEVVAGAEFDRWLAAHDLVIREDQAKKDAAIAKVRAQEYMSNINAVWADQARMNIDSRMGAGFSLNELATLLRGQSFTGTESEQNV